MNQDTDHKALEVSGRSANLVLVWWVLLEVLDARGFHSLVRFLRRIDWVLTWTAVAFAVVLVAAALIWAATQ
jgi:hypothetical protein